MDDPADPTLYRLISQPSFLDPNNDDLPSDILPRQVTLRDRQTVATIVPFSSPRLVPNSLLAYLCDQFNREIEGGDTYPMTDPFTIDHFADYWFRTFGAIMLLGSIDSAHDVVEGKDWSSHCLGSFFIRPNYPGRSSHVCNGSFLVTDASRNRGVGRLMGEAYLDWAPRLGYSYSVFNLVYETNVVSCRIWDALGFKRIGRVKACGNLRSYPDRLVDAIIYGRDLGPPGADPVASDDLVSEERFDKIRYYLKYGKYPLGADRAEKSRLRSAATHYKLLDDDRLMLKDKEVIADPARQYDIARSIHAVYHGGINKTTATIAEKYHWSRIKETASDVIRACLECRDLGKTPNPPGTRKMPPHLAHEADLAQSDLLVSALTQSALPASSLATGYANPSDISIPTGSRLTRRGLQASGSIHGLDPCAQDEDQLSQAHSSALLDEQPDSMASVAYQPMDLHMIHRHGSPHEHHHDGTIAAGVRSDVVDEDDDDVAAASPFDHYHQQHAFFQALLNATDDVVPGEASDAVEDTDLDMLIRQDDDDDDDNDENHKEEGGIESHESGGIDVGDDGHHSLSAASLHHLDSVGLEKQSDDLAP